VKTPERNGQITTAQVSTTALFIYVALAWHHKSKHRYFFFFAKKKKYIHIYTYVSGHVLELEFRRDKFNTLWSCSFNPTATCFIFIVLALRNASII
jgi:hypothetical protein